MKNTVWILLAGLLLGSQTFAALPKTSHTLTRITEMFQLLTQEQAELKDPSCFKSILNSKNVAALTALGKHIEWIEVDYRQQPGFVWVRAGYCSEHGLEQFSSQCLENTALAVAGCELKK